jgi:hypothetical protein
MSKKHIATCLLGGVISIPRPMERVVQEQKEIAK